VSARATREEGYLLIAALALMIVAGLLVAAIAELAAGEADSGSLRVQSARALHAAQAGLEVAVLQRSSVGTVGFGGGSFAVTRAGRTLRSTGKFGLAKREAACEMGFPYVDGTRVQDMDRDAVFRLANLTGEAITLTALNATWVSPAAHYETISMHVLGGTNYGKVWDFRSASNVRASSGETTAFNTGPAAVFPADTVAELRLGRFRSNKTGSAGANHDMDDTAFVVWLRAAAEDFAPTTARTK
jgi:hypothetical protein